MATPQPPLLPLLPSRPSLPTLPTPLNALPASTGPVPAASDAPPRKKRRLKPLLTVPQLSDRSAIADIVSIAEATSSEQEKHHSTRSHASLLAAVIRRASRWAATVAPQHSLAQFVVDARTLSTSRPFRLLLADIRLAYMRGAHAAHHPDHDALVDGPHAADLPPEEEGPVPTTALSNAQPPNAVAADLPPDDPSWDDADDALLDALEQNYATHMQPNDIAAREPSVTTRASKALPSKSAARRKLRVSDDDDEPDDAWFDAVEKTIAPDLDDEQPEQQEANGNGGDGPKAKQLEGSTKRSAPKARKILPDDSGDEDDIDIDDDGVLFIKPPTPSHPATMDLDEPVEDAVPTDAASTDAATTADVPTDLGNTQPSPKTTESSTKHVTTRKRKIISDDDDNSDDQIMGLKTSAPQQTERSQCEPCEPLDLDDIGEASASVPVRKPATVLDLDEP